MLNKKGITLVELLVVISVIGILVGAMAFTFTGWQAKYKIENQTKTMYMDLMNARIKAMQKNRAHFAVLAAANYSIYEDTSPAPDGDGVQTAADTIWPGFPKTLQYPLNWTGGGNTITFDKSGLSSPQGTIWFTTTESADSDCIIIAPTRINLGKWNGASCDAK